MPGALWIVLFLVVAVVLAVVIYICLQGEHDVRFLPQNKSTLTCEYIDKDRAIFSLSIPYKNFGKQEGIMTDAFVRVLLPKEQFDLAKIIGHFENSEARRDDDYMEAFIVRISEKGNFILTLEIIPNNSFSIDEILQNMVDFTIDIYYEVTGRTYPMIRKASLTLLLEEFQQAAAKGADKN